MLRSKYTVKVANTDAVFNAIVPEMAESIAGSRSVLNISKLEDAIVVQIESCDLASLRAATNSWLRLIIVATETDAILTEELNRKPHKCD